MRRLVSTLLAALAVAAMAVPTAAIGAGAEQIVITLVDEPAPWEFDDPSPIKFPRTARASST